MNNTQTYSSNKTATEIHQQAKAVLKRLGLSQKQAIALFFEQIVLKQDLPFSIMNSPKQEELKVNVSVTDGIWTAECDELGLVTEADSYEALTQRALEIAPELAELNAVSHFTLRFVQ